MNAALVADTVFSRCTDDIAIGRAPSGILTVPSRNSAGCSDRLAYKSPQTRATLRAVYYMLKNDDDFVKAVEEWRRNIQKCKNLLFKGHLIQTFLVDSASLLLSTRCDT